MNSKENPSARIKGSNPDGVWNESAIKSLFLVFRRPAGKAASPARPNFTTLTEVSMLSGPWEVSFDPKWGGPKKIILENLDDWSSRPETGIKYSPLLPSGLLGPVSIRIASD